MSHLTKNQDNQAYTNENAIETRIVDRNLNKNSKKDDELSRSQSQSEDDNNIQNKGI